MLCNCEFDDRVPEKEINFLKDQRLSRRMVLTSSRDVVFTKRKMQAFAKLPKFSEASLEEQPTCSKKVQITDAPSDAVLPTLLEPRKPNDGSTSHFADLEDHLSSSPTYESRESSLDDYHPPSECISEGKSYKKLHKFSISTSDCKNADRRLISIRQQSELQRSTVAEKSISASTTTAYRKREQCRKEALNKCEEEQRNAKTIQLCYDG